jgi:hypothetical protein
VQLQAGTHLVDESIFRHRNALNDHGDWGNICTHCRWSGLRAFSRITARAPVSAAGSGSETTYPDGTALSGEQH